MKKLIFMLLIVIPTFNLSGQSLAIENQTIDSLFASGKLSKDQASQLKKKWTSWISKYTYPEVAVNKNTGEAEFSEILNFSGLEKKVVFQRCLQWIAINYGTVIYNDLESGKIIANGSTDLDNFEEYRASLGEKLRSATTAASYALILTFKEDKIKYTITNVTFTFRNYSETIDEISFPAASLYPIVGQDQMQWVRSVTVLNAAKDKFSKELKNSLVNYIKDYQNDYKF